MSFNREKTLFCLTVLLFAVATASAVPTEGTSEPVLADRDVGQFQLPSVVETVAPADLQLAVIGREIAEIPLASASLPVSVNPGAKSLPAVPATTLLVITGFFCVSFTRDRKTWLATFTGLVWLGHAGASAVPQLAHHLCRQRHSDSFFAIKSIRAYQIKTSERSRCDLENTEYIGLLRHLAGIPQNRSVFQLGLKSEFCDSSERTQGRFKSSPSAIVSLSSRIFRIVNCSARPVGQIICFSPAFIFDNLARGPPATV